MTERPILDGTKTQTQRVVHRVVERPGLMSNVSVSTCQDCPCLFSNSEFPETKCRLSIALGGSGSMWGMGEYKKGDQAPKGCPLRRRIVRLRLLKEEVKP
jgi:hypothetical protein